MLDNKFRNENGRLKRFLKMDINIQVARKGRLTFETIPFV